jgi:hypothetical protein
MLKKRDGVLAKTATIGTVHMIGGGIEKRREVANEGMPDRCGCLRNSFGRIDHC